MNSTIFGRIHYYTLFMIAIVLSVSCGIDSVKYLKNPPVSIDSSGNLVFTEPSSIDPLFLGTEIFYRCYGTIDGTFAAAESDWSKLNQLQTSEDIPGRAVSYLLSDTGLKYRRPVRVKEDGTNTESNANIPPLIQDDEINTNYATITMGEELSLNLPDSLSDTKTTILKRNIAGSPSFSGKPTVGDSDYSDDGILDNDLQRYVIQILAASYGFDSSGLLDVYSNVVKLGTIVVEF